MSPVSPIHFDWRVLKRRSAPVVLFLLLVLPGCGSDDGGSAVGTAHSETSIQPESDGRFHVREGESIQAALDAAAQTTDHKRVVVHSGVYRPGMPSQAMIRFLARHDGIQLEAEGDVTLTAANRKMANLTADSYPAVVNHVVYFGHGVLSKTVLRGFRITGANGFVITSQSGGDILEPDHADPRLQKGMFFHSDGGAIKVFGRSSPKLVGLRIEENRTVLCGGGISIENCGYVEQATRIENCVFTKNGCPGTGSAIDVLEGSVAEVHNCLFTDNIANTGMAEVTRQFGLTYNPKHGCGALTVFPGSRVTVTNSTFTANWNGADDQGRGSRYQDCIFWMNTASDGSRPGDPFEVDIYDAAFVKGCFLNGKINDLQGRLDPQKNTLNAPDPQFDDQFRPQNEDYVKAGYRPASAAEKSRQQALRPGDNDDKDN
ncbi:MAG: right-handed parallel beta-helix repeat-containing protein [Planctomycetes bacterium]|nr:right-handed parallel beta-helix repeat-containing protein [Planctomycetota bacterium]